MNVCILFKGLFRNFGLAFVDNFIERLYVLIHEKTKEKHEGSHRVAAEIVAGMIRGSKYWTVEMVCHYLVLLLKNNLFYLA